MKNKNLEIEVKENIDEETGRKILQEICKNLEQNWENDQNDLVDISKRK